MFHGEIAMTKGYAIFNGREFLENELVLMSLSGRVIRKISGVGTITISLKGIESGVYMCAVRNKNGLLIATKLISIMQ